jgi:hypothetical protein
LNAIDSGQHPLLAGLVGRIENLLMGTHTSGKMAWMLVPVRADSENGL